MRIETTAIVCGHVFRDERPVRVVIHHNDGVWQLVCGEDDHPQDCGDFETVGLEHILDRQPDLALLSDMKRGEIAEQLDEGWSRSQFDE